MSRSIGGEADKGDRSHERSERRDQSMRTPIVQSLGGTQAMGGHASALAPMIVLRTPSRLESHAQDGIFSVVG